MKVSQGNKRGIAARRVTAAPRFALALLLAATAGSAGALFAPQPAMAQEAAATDNANNGEDENDPLEPMNRYFFELNKFFDTILIKPVATWYDGVVPEPGRDGVRNFLDNLRSPVILANDLLQGEWERAGTTASRFGINTTVGVLGLMDPAADWGMPQHSEDFGQTLGTYDVDEGPYLFLPVLGPAPPRDLTGFVVDQFFDPLTYVYWNESSNVPLIRFAVNGIDQRARSLNTLDQIERTSVDHYATVRNLYRQIRKSEIANGERDFDDLPDIDNLSFDTNEPNTPGMRF
ncbi:MAG: VacJ family lipoprotein [Parvibaculaceae bacterium]